MAVILVVEDDQDIQEALEAYLTASGHEARLAGDGVAAITVFQQQTPDLVLLDIMLPKVNGYGVLELIRRTSSVPVILLTALDAEQDQVKGFDLLADDYVTKPFSPKVLMKKIEAVLRRVENAHGNAKTIHYHEIELDVAGHTVSVSGKPVSLTQTEYDLLYALLTHQGQVLTRQALLDTVWSYDFFGDTRVVDNHIKNLRKKLDVSYIETIRGVGYRVAKEN